MRADERGPRLDVRYYGFENEHMHLGVPTGPQLGRTTRAAGRTVASDVRQD